jgi:cytochrome d ubiquinol oxidase subunit II
MAESCFWPAVSSRLTDVRLVLDGWNIGAGAAALARGEAPPAERREIIAGARDRSGAGHEGLGSLPVRRARSCWRFPKVMATSVRRASTSRSALVLWSFILRGVSIEVGGHLDDRLWRSWWDFVFATSSVVLAVLLGAALGNVVRGVPLDGSGKFTIPLFTDFGVRGAVGILDWFTVSIAVFTTLVLSAHGATYLRLKTEGHVHERSERLARWLWIIVLVLLPVVSLETWIVRPALYVTMLERPAAWPVAWPCWGESGRCSRGCGARRKDAPLPDRARSSPACSPAQRSACFP